jgi:hypothetical protein
MHLNILFVLLVGYTRGTSAVEVAELPILEVELAPPKEFMPQVDAMIASKERDSSSLEKAQLERLERAYQAAVISARKKIEDLVRNILVHPSFRKGSFLAIHSTSAQKNGDEFAVRLTIDSPPDSGKGWDTAIQQIAKKSYKEDREFFDAVVQDFAVLEQAILVMVQDALQKKVPIFLRLQSLPGKANVRVKPSSTGWPRLADLVSDWQDAHDARWHAVRGKVIELQSRYFAAVNKIIEESLQKYGSA